MALSDWHFEVDIDPQLDAAIYHSAPSALSMAVPSATDAFFSVNKLANCSKIKEGRIEFWYRHNLPLKIVGGVAFRIRTNAPVYDFSNCFVVIDGDDFWYLYWWDGLALNYLGEWAFETLHNTWRHLRVSWWEQALTLRVRLEYESGGVWSLGDVDVDSGVNHNSGEAIQAVGVMVNCTVAGATKVWFDDVKIYHQTTSS